MKLLKNLQNAWQIEELRKRILLTLLLLLVYRLGSYLPLPGVDPNQLSQLSDQTKDGLLGLLNAFTGGAFAKASILALGIMPYISASIVVQLMSMAIPYLQKLQKDGQSGRNKINHITRYLTIAITIVQAPTYLANLKNQVPESALLIDSNIVFWVTAIICLIAGTLFSVWLGEKITENGIGNGVSLLITVGIIARLPESLTEEMVSKVGSNTGGLLYLLLELVVWLFVIGLSILLVKAVRKIPLQYARVQGGRTTYVPSRQYLPLKLNVAGVMPIIFAQAIMFVPLALAGFFESEALSGFFMSMQDINGLWYNVFFFLLIVAFTYVYTVISVQTNQMADDMKRGGSFIPGVKPGASTAEYIDQVLGRLTHPAAIFLGVIAILPTFAHLLGVTQSFALFFGGTSLLIMVGVVLDTSDQVESYLLNSQYDDMLKSDRIIS